MKIVFINNLYKPYARGGAERVVEQRALEALEKGDDVTVITLAKNKSEHKQIFWDGKIKIIRIWPKNIFSYFDLAKHNFFTKLVWHLIDIFGSSRDLQQILLSEKPDVVETHNLMGVGFGIPYVNVSLKGEAIPSNKDGIASSSAKTTRNDIFELLPEIKDSAFIRELHTYGQLVNVGKNDAEASQHKGWGKKLVIEAEKIAKKNKYYKIAVISGVGVRGYYRKLGYKKVGTYMMKKLNSNCLK